MESFSILLLLILLMCLSYMILKLIIVQTVCFRLWVAFSLWSPTPLKAYSRFSRFSFSFFLHLVEMFLEPQDSPEFWPSQCIDNPADSDQPTPWSFFSGWQGEAKPKDLKQRIELEWANQRPSISSRQSGHLIPSHMHKWNNWLQECSYTAPFKSFFSKINYFIQ